jgi:hypothetical protein
VRSNNAPCWPADYAENVSRRRRYWSGTTPLASQTLMNAAVGPGVVEQSRLARTRIAVDHGVRMIIVNASPAA